MRTRNARIGVTSRQWEAATVFYVLKRVAAARMIGSEAASRAAPARPRRPLVVEGQGIIVVYFRRDESSEKMIHIKARPQRCA